MRRIRKALSREALPFQRAPLATALLLGCALFVQPAHAFLSNAELKLEKDGVANFDPTPGSGMDTGPQNGIVRTHDTLEYQLSLSTNQGAKSPWVELSLPLHNGQPVARWVSVPTKCATGGISTDGQRLVCVLADFPAGRTEATNFHAQVLGSAANGTPIAPPTARVGTAHVANAPLTNSVQPVRVSAAPFYDVLLLNGNPREATFQLGGGPSGQSTMYMRPFLGLMARHPNGWGKIGVEQLDPSQPIRIDVGLSGFPGQSRTDGLHPQLVNWLPTSTTTFSFGDGCGNSAKGAPDRRSLGGGINNYGLILDHGPDGIPSTISDLDRKSAVYNGGDCRVTGSSRDSISLALDGVDTTLVSAPTQFFRTAQIPSSDHWLAGKVMVLWSDVGDYELNRVYTPELRIRSVTAPSISGANIQNVRTDNDAISIKVLVQSSGETSKAFLPDSTLPRPYSSFPDGLINGGRVEHLAPRQVVGATLRYNNTGASTHEDVRLCEVLDRTAFDLATHFSARLIPTASYPINSRRVRYGAHSSGSPYFSSTDSANAYHEEGVEGRSAYSSATCDGPHIQWFNTAQEAERAGGLVYIRGEMDELHGGHSVTLQISGLQLRETWAATIQVEAPRPLVRRGGEAIEPGSIIRNRSLYSTSSTGVVNLHSRPTRNQDHLEAVEMVTVARISKEITDPPNAALAPVPVGTVVSYRLSPRFSTTFPPQPRTVSITDVLPANVRYVSGSARMDGQPQEPIIQRDQPAAGMTTLIWRLENRLPHAGENSEAGAALPVITYQARLGLALVDGTEVKNLAAISGGGNDLERDCVFNPALGTYGTCAKAATSKLSIQTPPGFQLEKQAQPPEIEPGDPFAYTLTFVSMGQDIHAPHVPDLIDILPFVGDGVANTANSRAARQPASRFTAGAYRLQSVTPASLDPNAGIYYTSRRPDEIHNDPQHSSNQMPGGSTRWCQASEFGTNGCPRTIGESTAVRVRPALSTLPRNRPYEVQLNLLSDSVLAQPGDIFANRVGSRPAARDSTLLYVESQNNLNVRIIGAAVAALSGRVFVDNDQDNVFDPEDQALAGQCIVLRGTRRTPDDVLASIRTDASGHFSFAAGAQNRVFASADCSGTALAEFAGLLPGEYSLHKPALSAGHQSGASHVGTLGGTAGSDRIDSIHLQAGEQGNGYHLTEQPVPPILTLAATISHDQGGSARLEDAVLSASREGDAGNPALSGSPGHNGIVRVSVPAGRYRLSGSVLPGYRSGPWQCVVNGQPRTPLTMGDALGIDLALGEQAVCTLPYDDQPARLTLKKALDLRHGRSAALTDFLLHADAQAPTPTRSLSGRTGDSAITAVELPAGRYALREDNLPGFLAQAWRCQLGDDSSQYVPVESNVVTLDNGQDVVCTLTNTDTPRLSLDLVNTDGLVARRENPQANPAPELPAVEVYVTLLNDPERQITLRLDSEPMELALGDRYRLSASETPGYTTKLLCRRADGSLAPDTLSFGTGNISCEVERKRVPATLNVTKALDGAVQLVPGTLNEYTLGYRMTVSHTGGADTLYDLIDTPAFDPDVEILSHSSSRNGSPLNLVPSAGRWTLASNQPLAIGATDTYQMQLRIRVPFGGNDLDDGCASGEAGKGLFNQVLLTNRQDGSDAGALSTHRAHACADTPLPVSRARLSIEKTSTLRSAEIGDLISYQLRIRNSGEGPALMPIIVDRLPRGFSFEPRSVRVQGAQQISAQLSSARELRIQLDRVDSAGTASSSTSSAASGEVLISYRVRIGVGAQESDGTNRAHIECPSNRGRGPASRCSNESRWKIQVKAGIFSEEACLAGQIFVDCNGNSVKDAEELGIPGVRLYLQNGTWLVSDAHGKYSHCGLRPRTHVLKVDSRTLPRRARLVTSSAQNSGDAESLFIDARKGMLHRADFIEGSCSATVIEQVKARQAQGTNTSTQTEAGQPGLSFDSKQGAAAAPLREGTDGARQARPFNRH